MITEPVELTKKLNWLINDKENIENRIKMIKKGRRVKNGKPLYKS